MRDLFSARPWVHVQKELAAADISYTVRRTHTPRAFFKVDEAQLYVVRVREADGRLAVTLAPGPMRSASLAARETG